MLISYLIKKVFANLFICLILLILLSAYSKADPANTIQAKPELEAQEISTHANIPPTPLSDEIKNTIKKQLKAFQERDQNAVWLTVGAGLKEKYNSQTEFYQMIRYGYRAIYNHQSVTFLSQNINEDTAIQKISFKQDQDTPAVLFIYRLKKQEDGIWKIEGFVRIDPEGERAG